MPLFVGLISGTSMDAIDAALVDIDAERVKLLAFVEIPYDRPLRDRLEKLVRVRASPIDEIGELDTVLGHAFAAAALTLLEQQGMSPSLITAIGSHGQTIGHGVEGQYPYTLQIANPSVIAYRTGILTVADFRSKDIAAGGQGAPLVPGFHEHMFRRAGRDVAVVNIGGISNVSLLASELARPILGFDCGPGNTLMDLWIQRHRGEAFDVDGRWAASGTSNEALLTHLLGDAYFARQPPKSTGRELFHLDWLDQHLACMSAPPSAADVQATLAELTTQCIIGDIDRHLPACTDIAICGGGARNSELMRRLRTVAGQQRSVYATDEIGLPAAAIEACTFAWLAARRLQRLPGNVSSVTGATAPVILGGIYAPD
jgi:anhydro-N-acetylmuramic acid kinase